MSEQGPVLDAEALAAHRGFVQALARKLVADTHLAEDVAQESLLAAMKNPPPRTVLWRRWLARIVRNRSYTLLRDAERRKRKERAAAAVGAAPGAADEVERLAGHAKVVETLLSLDEPYRSTLVLRFYEDLPPRAIAKRLSMPAATVRTRLKRGLDMMRARLDAEHGGNRLAWCLALLPLAFPPKAVAGVAATGAVAMSMKTKVTIAAVLLLAAALVGVMYTAVTQSGEEVERVRAPGARGSVASETVPAAETPREQGPASEPARLLTVLVTTLAGEPIAGARLGIHVVAFRGNEIQSGEVQEPHARATTDGEGKASLPLTEAPQWVVRAVAEGYAADGRYVSHLHPAEEPVTIRLGRAYPLAGRVTDSAGAPIPGAVVLASDANVAPNGGNPTALARAVTDAAGRYAFDALPGRDRSLWVALPEWVPVFVDLVRIPGVESYDIVVRRGGTVTGVVTEEATGKPIAGAEVTVHVEVNYVRVRARGSTDTAGRYRIDSVPECRIRSVVARKKGYAQVRGVAWEGARSVRGDILERDIRLARAARVHGRVLSAEGPVAGASVEAWHMGFGHRLKSVRTRTGPQGDYELADLAPGKHVLRVMKPGYDQPTLKGFGFMEPDKEDPSQPHVVEVGPGGDVRHDLEIRRGDGIVEGRVLGPGGGPLAGVKVAESSGAKTETQEDGAFRLEGVALSVYTYVNARKDGFDPASVRLKPESGPRFRDIVLRLVARRTERKLTGTVRAADGGSLEETFVLVSPKKEQHRRRGRGTGGVEWYQAARVSVDPDGRYEFDVSTMGDVHVRAVARGYAPSAVRELAGDDPEPRLDFVLDRGHAVKGRVLRKDSRAPVPRARIYLHGSMFLPHRINPVYGPEHAVRAVADAQGRFVLQGVPAGRYELHAAAPGFVDGYRFVKVPAEEDVVCELEPELSIRGTVVGADGKPVPRVYVLCKLEHNPNDAEAFRRYGHLYQHHTDARGRFDFRHLKPGRYKITVGGLGGEMEVAKTIVPNVPAGTEDLRVVVKAGLSIAGRVVDGRGNGIAGAHVYAQPAHLPRTGYRRYGETDVGGRFVVHGLEEGAHYLRVVVRHPRGGRREIGVEDVPTGTSDLVIRAEADFETIAGRLVDESGAGVSYVWLRTRAVEVDESYGTYHRVLTDASGRFRFEGLGPGTYDLVLDGPGDRIKGWLFEGGGGTKAGTLDVVLRVREGATIRGTVVDTAGRPIEKAYIYAVVGKAAYTDAHGRFTLRGLPHGHSSDLQCFADGRATLLRKGVSAGTQGLSIVMEKGFEASGRVLDASGEPLVRVLLECVAGDGEGPVLRFRTNQKGEFAARRLRNLEYRVKAEGRELGTIRAGATGVELRLPE